MSITLDVALVFDDWRQDGQSIYSTAMGLSLSTGNLHSGSTFPATITLDEDTAEDLRTAVSAGFQPVFWMWIRKAEPCP